MTEAEQKQMFDDMANNPLEWSAAANDNLVAADVIDAAMAAATSRAAQGMAAATEPVMRLSWKSRMLRAYAVECLLKAIFVKNGNKLGDGGMIIRNAFPTNHDLVEMWTVAGLTPLPAKDERRHLLEKLAQISTSLGRYPIAMRWNKPKPDLVKNSLMDWTTSEDQKLAALLKDLKSQLPPLPPSLGY